MIYRQFGFITGAKSHSNKAMHFLSSLADYMHKMITIFIRIRFKYYALMPSKMVFLSF